MEGQSTLAFLDLCCTTGKPASQVALGVKNPPAKTGDAEKLVRSLDWEDHLE